MKAKGFLLLVMLFLGACAPDSPGGSGNPAPRKVVSQEQRERAQLLSDYYVEWRSELRKVSWIGDQEQSAADMTAAFVLGSISRKYLLYLKKEDLLVVFEVFKVLPDGNPESPQLLELAEQTLKH